MNTKELEECIKTAAKLRAAGRITVKSKDRPAYQLRRYQNSRYANQPGMSGLKSNHKLYMRAFMRLTRGKPIDDILELAKKL